MGGARGVGFRLFIICSVTVAVLVLSITESTPANGATDIREIDYPAFDIINDPVRGVIYASGANGVVPIDPETGTVGAPLFALPGELEFSSDYRYLYSGGSHSIWRYDLDSQAVDAITTVPGFHQIEDFEVSPSDPGVIAASLRNDCCSPRHEGVVIFEDGVLLPNKTPRHTGSNVIEFAGANLLYGYDNESTGFEFRTMVVDSQGVTVSDVTPGLMYGFGNDFEVAGGLVYDIRQRAVDPVAKTILGTFARGGWIEPDLANDRVFALSNLNAIEVYSRSTFTYLASVPVPAGTGPLIRWGDDGLAYRSSDGIVLVESDAVNEPLSTPLPQPVQLGSAKRLALDANDLTYLSSTGKIYASIDSSVIGHGNRLAVINPDTGQIESTHFIGSDPGRIKETSDSSFIYAALDGATAASRFNVNSLSLEQQFPLRFDSHFGRLKAEDIAPIPGSPLLVLASMRHPECCINLGVAAFDDSVQLPVFTSEWTGPLEGAGSNLVYGFNDYSSGFELRTLTLDSTGVSRDQQLSRVQFRVTRPISNLVAGSFIRLPAGSSIRWPAQSFGTFPHKELWNLSRDWTACYGPLSPVSKYIARMAPTISRLSRHPRCPKRRD